jgi:hypothetical protein
MQQHAVSVKVTHRDGVQREKTRSRCQHSPSPNNDQTQLNETLLTAVVISIKRLKTMIVKDEGIDESDRPRQMYYEIIRFYCCFDSLFIHHQSCNITNRFGLRINYTHTFYQLYKKVSDIKRASSGKIHIYRIFLLLITGTYKLRIMCEIAVFLNGKLLTLATYTYI